MGKYYYKKASGKKLKLLARLFSLFLVVSGLGIASYVFFPLVSWQIYFAPVFAQDNIAVPIPKATVVNADTIQSLISQASQNFSGVDYNNADNWFPGYKYQKGTPIVDSYYMSIPKLNITNAVVSATDDDLAKHLVNFGGTTIPPEKGNAVVFGHSTLPWLFNQNNYKTIFARAYELQVGDNIYVTVSGATYKYTIYNITVVSPNDTSVLEQDYNQNLLTLITCTPPGTTWKRLVIRSRLTQS